MICSSVKLMMRRCMMQGRGRRCYMLVVGVSLLSLWMLTTQVFQPKTELDVGPLNIQRSPIVDPPVSRTKMPLNIPRPEPRHLREEEPVYRTMGKVFKETDLGVLVLREQSHSGQRLINILMSNRFKTKTALVYDNVWPSFTQGDRGLFSVIIFESLRSYMHLSSVKSKVINDYCRTYNIGIIIFTNPDVSIETSQVRKFPLYIDQHVKLKDPYINQSSVIPRIAKANQRFYGNLPGDKWTTFRTNHSTYVSVMKAKAIPPDQFQTPTNNMPSDTRTCVVHDNGAFDGIQRIFFGNTVDLFFHSILLLDGIAHLTRGQLQKGLERYVLVDIDDMFVGSTGIRLTAADVEHLVSSQEELAQLVPGFRFNLGFSGKYFQHGTEEENAGDQKVLEEARHFWWFPHMWDHQQPHSVSSLSKLKTTMLKNKQFAIDHNIPLMEGYSIAPHHSGVYPVHEQLYDAWKEVWNIEATSTEEYPHLRPAYSRRGFIHKNIMVVPRQTCGLFTHTNHFDEFRGGRTALDAMIQGGELFMTIVNNPVNIFMTHMSNYGSDRLGPYTFQHVFQFIKMFTNLQLQTLPPVQTARKYFELFPNEREPLWGNPCDDKRLVEIWSPIKDCSRLPNSLILGPQKTGTTALYTFLQMHKRVRSNRLSDKTFEEVQFFNGPSYYNGLDWYLDFFPSGKNLSHVHIFEKSANYFDSPSAPKRVKALIPKAKLIVILLDPAKRAYSWYQHMRAHSDETSLQYSFRDIIMAKSDAPKPVRDLQKRCLEPGRYATHLERWLQYFSPRQLLLLDGELLREDPPHAMQKVQRFLRIKPALDYSRLLRYDSQKGFYCPVGIKNRTHCLGKGKGRKYPEMDEESAEFLKAYYRQENLMLSTVLDKISQAMPEWLSDQLKEF